MTPETVRNRQQSEKIALFTIFLCLLLIVCWEIDNDASHATQANSYLLVSSFIFFYYSSPWFFAIIVHEMNDFGTLKKAKSWIDSFFHICRFITITDQCYWFINGIALPFAIEPSTPQTGRRIKYVESKVPQAIVTHPKSNPQQAVHFQSSSGTNTVDICTRRFVCEEQKTTASIKYELQILIRWVLSTVSTQQQKLTIFHTSWMN